MFSGFKSRCMILFSCMWAKPYRSPLRNVLISSLEKLPFFWIYLNFYLLNFVENLPAWQYLHYDVNWILRFKNTFKSQSILVIQASHNCQLIHKAFLAVLCCESILLWKGFDCESSEICDSLDFVNRSKISFSKFLDWLEKFMETFLIDKFGEVEDPDINKWGFERVKTVEFRIGKWELDSKFFGMNIFLR